MAPEAEGSSPSAHPILINYRFLVISCKKFPTYPSIVLGHLPTWSKPEGAQRNGGQVHPFISHLAINYSSFLIFSSFNKLN